MKNLRKILMYGLWLCMLFPLLTQLSIRAEALVGMGTPDSPYLVYTSEDVLAIAQNPNGHYMLMADIDMSSVELFTPIGNETTGPFTGVLDGNGHTISGLFIYHPNAKASGFVAYNEGTIKNLIIDAEVCGGRYTGGIAAHNCGTIDNCAMQGELYTYGAPLETAMGGITAYNEGSITNCINFANVVCDAEAVSGRSIFIGGVIGINSSDIIIDNCVNYGAIVGKATIRSIGGIVATALENQIIINNCTNYGDINTSSTSYTGGILGETKSNVISKNCTNSGNITCNINAGGFCGYIMLSKGLVNIENFFNHGDITTSGILGSVSGGVAGIYEGANSLNILNSCNTGNITGKVATGFIGMQYASGNNNMMNTICLENLLNAGKITGTVSSPFFAWYYIGDYYSVFLETRTGAGSTKNCHNIGLVESEYPYYRTKFTSSTECENCLNTGLLYNNSGKSINSYTIDSGIYRSTNYYNSGSSFALKSDEKTEAELRQTSTFDGWDWENIWGIDPLVNGGFPYLQWCKAYYPGQSKVILQTGEKEKMLIDPKKQDNSTGVWISSDPSVAVIDKEGNIYGIAAGFASVSYITPDLQRITCIVHVYEHGDINILTIPTVNSGATLKLEFSLYSQNDYIIHAIANTDHIEVVEKTNSYIIIKGVRPGKGELSVETATGEICTVEFVVTNDLKSLSVSTTATVNRNDTTTLSLTRTPTSSTTPITWSSSDESIAKVDQNGVVTGVALGTVTITAKAENGVTDTCSVTVKAPIEKLDMMRTAVTLTVGDTDQLSTIFAPLDTTDTITYSTSSSTYVSVVSSTGEITAKRAGQATITAKASSGLTAQCIVTVVDAPAEGVGVPIGGRFVSNDPTTDTTLQLWQNGKLVRTATVGAISAGGLTTQDFVIEGVKKGTYDLHIMKPGCFPVIITGIYVDGVTPIALTAHGNPNVQLIKLVAGDLNGDGVCNLADVAILRQNDSYGKTRDDFIFSYIDPNR